MDGRIVESSSRCPRKPGDVRVFDAAATPQMARSRATRVESRAMVKWIKNFSMLHTSPHRKVERWTRTSSSDTSGRDASGSPAVMEHRRSYAARDVPRVASLERGRSSAAARWAHIQGLPVRGDTSGPNVMRRRTPSTASIPPRSAIDHHVDTDR